MNTLVFRTKCLTTYPFSFHPCMVFVANLCSNLRGSLHHVLAMEKLAEGMRSFSADIVKL